LNKAGAWLLSTFLPYLEIFDLNTATVYQKIAVGGFANDPMAVVDERLRLYGIAGLRVVDASAMPDLVSAHINACVLMMAEKASDMILEDARAA